MALKFLDEAGLSYFWSKIKAHFKWRNIVPENSKTFTGVVSSANSDPAAWLYFGWIKPDSYYIPYKIHYRLHVTIGGLASTATKDSYYDVTIYGLNNTYYSYHVENVVNTSYRGLYSHVFYSCTETGINNGYGPLLGIRFQSSYSPASTTYARVVDVDILETENCDFTFFDSMILYANAPGTGTTNYNTRTAFDGTTNGHTQAGDRNDVNYYNRNYYGCRTAYTAIYRYQLCLSRPDRSLLPINSVNNSVATNKVLTTEAFDPFGDILYWASTTTYAAGANVGDGWYNQYLADIRYSFNIGGNDVASTLVGRKPLYLVAVPQANGTAKLHSSPLAQDLPSSEDGLIYIYLGQVYPDTRPYRLYMAIRHPVYIYKNGAVRDYRGYASDAGTVNGHAVASDVPANAVFTDTVTTATTSGSGNAVTAISASNGALTVTKGTTFLTQHQDISGKANVTAVAASASISDTGLITYKNSSGTALFTLQLPVYNGSVSGGGS